MSPPRDTWPERIAIPTLRDEVVPKLDFVIKCLNSGEDRQSVAKEKLIAAATLVRDALVALVNG